MEVFQANSLERPPMRQYFERSIIGAAALFAAAGLCAGEASAATCVQEKTHKNVIYFSSCTVSQFLDTVVPSLFPSLKTKLYVRATWEDPSIKGKGFFNATLKSISKTSALITGRAAYLPTTKPSKVVTEKFKSSYSVPAPELGLGLPVLGLIGYLAWRQRRQPAVAFAG